MIRNQKPTDDDLFGKQWPGAALKQLVVIICLVFVGCRSTAIDSSKSVSPLVRINSKANELYKDGSTQRAMDAYLEVLYAAWATDDAEQAGSTAYHLAACHFSMGELDIAKDWLLDARYELSRVDSPMENTWILEAKIARAEMRYEDIPYLLGRAKSQKPETKPFQGVREGLMDNLPEFQFTSAKTSLDLVRVRRSQRRSQVVENLPLDLIRANVAIDRGDLNTARRHLRAMKEVLDAQSQPDLQAEWHRISGELALIEQKYQTAAEHFDEEVNSLKQSKVYRDLAEVLAQSAKAYERGGNPDIAADRLCRAARVHFGKGNYQAAWDLTQEAGRLSANASNATIQVRLRLLAEQTLSELPDVELER